MLSASSAGTIFRRRPDILDNPLTVTAYQGSFNRTSSGRRRQRASLPPRWTSGGSGHQIRIQPEARQRVRANLCFSFSTPGLGAVWA
ncbi:hypothetical protein CEXT_399111 [Caerostris extrusa]|uniref:Uncharacterized protein n=1 Tax=Caerostris extrusa TaxID=172846 RepID=A0AAV4XFU8_CAEEX|nr:hypothetical protein CEXT_399111 [Caerostris extrusa]